MDEITIQKATSADFETIKRLMLIALKLDPFAFNATFEEYSANSDDWWRNYIWAYLSYYKDAMFLAKIGDEVVGMIGSLYEYRVRRMHNVSIVWFYVTKDYRGKGIGKKLLAEVLKD